MRTAGLLAAVLGLFLVVAGGTFLVLSATRPAEPDKSTWPMVVRTVDGTITTPMPEDLP